MEFVDYQTFTASQSTDSAHTYAPIDPVAASDRRRRMEGSISATILERSAALPTHERLLIVAAYRDGMSAVQLALTLKTSASIIRRCLKRLVHRLLSPRYIFVLTQRDLWPSTCRKVATACFIEGRSQRDAAERLGLTLHTVRRYHDSIASQADHAASIERALARKLARGEVALDDLGGDQ
ncbi:MAG: hypothetical protein AB7Q00_04190 [Phycisphaerales bacterium]|nr:MAG: hypothetical protein IPK69_08805 [Phycisphaerales bacterium]